MEYTLEIVTEKLYFALPVPSHRLLIKDYFAMSCLQSTIDLILKLHDYEINIPTKEINMINRKKNSTLPNNVLLGTETSTTTSLLFR